MIQNTKIAKVIIISIVLIILYLVFEWYISNDMTSLPTGTNIQSIESPNGNYIMNVYRVDGGSISADAIRVEIETIENGETKNIYYSYPESFVDAEWVDDSNVKINNIQLNIHKDKYKNKGI